MERSWAKRDTWHGSETVSAGKIEPEEDGTKVLEANTQALPR